ncbi:EAL and HDOD domain-containing protein [Methylotenera oryzisoli]|nr:HDOD domain-containing protein [Methylotenera oryzisoli]
MQNKLVSYQPITDVQCHLVGIDLVVDKRENATDNISESVISALHPFLCLETAGLFANHQVFVKVDEQFLMADALTLLPKTQVVLTLVRCDVVSEDLINRCSVLADMGYSLALDDWADKDPRLPLLAYAKFVRINLEHGLQSISDVLVSSTANLIAVETNCLEQRECSENIGVNLYQGYYYLDVRPDATKSLPLSVHVILEVIAELNSDGSDAALERFFRENPVLSVQMLRMVNSAAIGAGREVSSIRHAIMILGRGQMIRWLQVMLYTQRDTANVPTMLMYTALWRAKLMELMSTQCNHHGSTVHHDAVFMTGMLSLADVLLNDSMNSVVAKMSLATSIRDALLNRSGVAGSLLALVEFLELAKFADVEKHASVLGTTIEVIMACQNEALIWVDQIASSLDI